MYHYRYLMRAPVALALEWFGRDGELVEDYEATGFKEGSTLSSLTLPPDSGRHRITFRAGDTGGIKFTASSRAQTNAFVVVGILLNGRMSGGGTLERAILDFITHTLREEVARFRMSQTSAATVVGWKIFPSLECVLLQRMVEMLWIARA